MSKSLFREAHQMAENVIADSLKVFNVVQILPRFEAAINELRHDYVIGHIYEILKKKATDIDSVVTASDFQKWYGELIGLNPNSEFRVLFADLLPNRVDDIRGNAANIRHEYYDSFRDLTQKSTIEESVIETKTAEDTTGSLSDDLLMLSLNFGSDIMDRGLEVVKTELKSFGGENIKASVRCGNQNYLLYTVNFENKGISVEAGVPVEVKDNLVLLPELLTANGRTYSFDRKGIDTLINDVENIRTKRARDKFSDVRINEGRDDISRSLKAEEDSNIEVDEFDTIIPQVNLPDELLDVEAIMIDAVLQKESKFDNTVVQNGRGVLSNELKALGYKEHSISFTGDYKNGCVYKVSLLDGKKKIAIQVPMEIRQNKALIPGVFLAADVKLGDPQSKLYDFNTNGFQKFASDNVEFIDEIRYDAGLLNMSLNELNKIIHAATLKSEHAIAREALNLIQDKFGAESHAIALGNYQHWIEQASLDNQIKCGGCDYHLPKGGKRVNGKIVMASVHSEDYCLLVNTACKNVTKDNDTGICTKSSIAFDRLRDDHYKGELVVSQIKLT